MRIAYLIKVYNLQMMRNNPHSPQIDRLGIVVYRDVFIPMRDGIRLATDLFRPARDGEPLPGPFPTILCRTPYDKTDRRYSEMADTFTPLGYVVVLQDLRDRQRSEGSGDYEHSATPHEGRDGYDTIEWIASRPWSNARVGMVGSSFAAITQVRAALERPPHLTAIWPDVTPTDNYQHQGREGGAMQLQMFWALFVHAQDAQDIRDDPARQAQVWEDLRNMRQLLLDTPWKAGQLSLRHTPKLEEILLNYYTRGVRDAWWDDVRNCYPAHFHAHADIPGTFSTGWYDAYPLPMTEYYAAMARQNRQHQRLVVGPWGHGGMRGESSFMNEVDFGPDSVWGVKRYFAEQLHFFERTLRDQDNGLEQAPPVRIFVMGGGSGQRIARAASTMAGAGATNRNGRWHALPGHRCISMPMASCRRRRLPPARRRAASYSTRRIRCPASVAACAASWSCPLRMPVAPSRCGRVSSTRCCACATCWAPGHWTSARRRRPSAPARLTRACPSAPMCWCSRPRH